MRCESVVISHYREYYIYLQGTIAAQFNCEGTTLSGVDFELVGPGYRLSLVKRRFVSGKYSFDAGGELLFFERL